MESERGVVESERRKSMPQGLIPTGLSQALVNSTGVADGGDDEMDKDWCDSNG